MHEPHSEATAVRALHDALGAELGAGQLGLVVAAPGMGKSALLVHLALDTLFRDRGVLHVALRESVDHARGHYDEVLRAMSAARQRDPGAAQVAAERRRMIHSYQDRAFEPGHLRKSLEMLRDVAQFEPRLLVIDGLDEARLDVLAGVQSVAEEFQLPVWIGLRSDGGPVPPLAARQVSAVLRLVSADGAARLRLERDGETTDLGLQLDPTTLLLGGDAADSGRKGRAAPAPGECTLYSGGANGAEAAFGEAAERWGLTEVSFTFEGHKQSRTRGSWPLSPRELAAGDVSLVYVSRKLNRTYTTESTLIKKVLQTLWHMVSRSQQIFVVGQILEDGTVVGGTGWSVELARTWNKEVWVYDQEKDGWFRWEGQAWMPGVPTITGVHFCGTGTRYLTPAGKGAITDLFERSFTTSPR